MIKGKGNKIKKTQHHIHTTNACYYSVGNITAEHELCVCTGGHSGRHYTPSTSSMKAQKCITLGVIVVKY
jgi:hypothetical protein